MRLAAVTIFAMMPLPAMAQGMADAPEPACAAPAPPPAGMEGWRDVRPLDAARATAGKAAATLPIGRARAVRLPPEEAVRYVVAPEKPGATGSHGGMLAFTVKRAGTYRVALGSAAWIDVVRDGAVVTSTAHGHGPVCSGIRKMVDFALSPARYTLQLAGSVAPDLRVLVARLP